MKKKFWNGAAALALPAVLTLSACEDFNRPLKPWIDEQYEMMKKVWDVSVSPQKARVSKGFTQQFAARVNVRADADQSVTWSVSGASDPGTAIGADGLLAIGAGEVTGACLTIAAVSVFDSQKSASVSVIVCAPVTVTFDPSVSALPAISFEANIDGPVNPPALNPDPAPAGFVFDGWHTQKSGGSRVTFPFAPQEDITLYARWKYNAPVTAGHGWASAIAAANAASPGSFAVDILGAFPMPSGGTSANPVIAHGVILTVTGSGTISLGAGESSCLLNIANGASVTLDGPALRGNADNTEGLVKIGEGGEFTLKSGTIAGNSGSGAKGGVHVAGGTFAMTGGSISGNYSAYFGGGVYVDGGTFTMTGGSISGNTVNIGGGGVAVDSSGIFEMAGGTISGNNTDSIGAGVLINNGTFEMTDGAISGNEAGMNGAGVSVGVFSNGFFTMNGGTITGNIAGIDGGGVNVGGISYGFFTMSGGTIIGNTAGADGGGVNVTHGYFILNGGAARNSVTNNISESPPHDARASGGVITVDGAASDGW